MKPSSESRIVRYLRWGGGRGLGSNRRLRLLAIPRLARANAREGRGKCTIALANDQNQGGYEELGQGPAMGIIPRIND